MVYTVTSTTVACLPGVGMAWRRGIPARTDSTSIPGQVMQQGQELMGNTKTKTPQGKTSIRNRNREHRSSQKLWVNSKKNKRASFSRCGKYTKHEQNKNKRMYTRNRHCSVIHEIYITVLLNSDHKPDLLCSHLH